jgi:cytochrome c553
MKHMSACLYLLALTLGVAPGWAAAKTLDLRREPVEGDARAGEAKAGACVACHGPDGNSVGPAFPSLAGQPATYLYVQLRAYREGTRASDIMRPFVEPLTDQDMKDLAAHYAAQTPRAATGGDGDGDATRGAMRFTQGDPTAGVPPCQGRPTASDPPRHGTAGPRSRDSSRRTSSRSSRRSAAARERRRRTRASCKVSRAGSTTARSRISPRSSAGFPDSQRCYRTSMHRQVRCVRRLAFYAYAELRRTEDAKKSKGDGHVAHSLS